MSSASATILRLPGDLNQKTLEAFQEIVEPHVQRADDGALPPAEPEPGVVFDLEQLTFVNSTGLGYIVSVGKRLAEQRRRLALARPTRQVEKLIRMVGLGEMLPLFKTLDDASRHVAG